MSYRHDEQRDVPGKHDGEREVQWHLTAGIEQKGDEPDKSERKPEAGPKHRPKNALSAGGSPRLSLERVLTRHRLLLLLHESAPSSRVKNVFTHAYCFFVPFPHGVREIRVLVAQSVGPSGYAPPRWAYPRKRAASRGKILSSSRMGCCVVRLRRSFVPMSSAERPMGACA